ncbi:hypothetical protein [Corallococcus sp. 4LFB]|uniref:hypothetical protein n=1 Tax=Corallococcus sp. 4LFB TaxID=3383249 RepID=UPI003976406A
MMRGQGWVLLCGLAASPALAEEDWLRPTLVGEVDYRQHGSDVEGFDGFTLARLRLGAEARPVSWLVARGVAEWALEKPVLIDAFVAFTGLKDWRISLGYNKTPLFPSAHDEHLEARAIPELSGLDQAFWPRRDLGLEVRWTPSTLPLETWVRVGNGSRSPLGNDNQHPALDTRVDGRWGRSAGATQSFWGARVGAGVHVESAFDRAGIGGTGPQGFVYYRPPPISGTRTVTEAHARVDAGRLRVAAEAPQRGSDARATRTATQAPRARRCPRWRARAPRWRCPMSYGASPEAMAPCGPRRARATRTRWRPCAREAAGRRAGAGRARRRLWLGAARRRAARRLAERRAGGALVGNVLPGTWRRRLRAAL